jgi:long-chain acyl-CoA synthetase
VPAVFRALLQALARGERGRHAALRVCVCGGAPLSPELQGRWFDTTGVELRQGYGLTEAGPVCLFNHVDQPNLRGMLGNPFPGVEVDLRAPISYDAAGQPHVAPDADPEPGTGEICVRGENVFSGYVSRGENGLPLRDGWLHTGDLGRRDAGGRIAFAGLVKPMFTRNGFNIYPREIERVVAGMPGVAEATVREAPVTDAEPDISVDVRGAVDVEAVKQWCAGNLSAYKRPTVITIR